MFRKHRHILAALLAALTLLTSSAVLAGEAEPLLLTLDQLRQFDGKDGRPAYVAVDGIIYDMTNSAAWKNGAHNGFQAGADLTQEIKEVSPHGVGKLENVVEVGRLSVLLTLEELKSFDGKDGRRAYVAVDGVIYDMTDSRAWKNGAHNGFQAGADLTEGIKTKSPHGVGKLENVVEIGRLLPEMTLEELAAYDGKDGRSAYVAVNGVVYDVTGNPAWPAEGHKGALPGNDLSEVFAQSPHEAEVLEGLPVVGKIKQ